MPVLNIRRGSTATGAETRVADPAAPPLTAPVRNRYFYGKMLDVRHLEMEQAYFIEHRRRLNRLTVGFGVVCGLEVTVGKDGKAICIAPGFAIDGLGREIVVTEQICIDDPGELTDSCGRAAGKATQPLVTICLGYHECESDPSPVLVDDCDVREGCAAGAVRERYKVLVHDGVPAYPPYGDLPQVCRLLAARLGSLGLPGAHPETHATVAPATTFLPHYAATPRLPSDGAAFLSCNPPDEDCVVLATVTLPDGDLHPEPEPDLTYRRIVLSQDHLFEAILCLAAAVERCCAKHEKTIEVVAGDAQEGKPDQPLAEAIDVAIKDSDGDPVVGETVDFTVTSALGGSFQPAQDKTDNNGRVKIQWTVGKSGPQTAVAKLADGGAEAALTATAKD
jgi:hypothetical protein